MTPTSSLYHSTSTIESPNCVFDKPLGGKVFNESEIFNAGGGSM